MKVIISFEWIFEVFNLAKQLYLKGQLYRLYMPDYYPHFSYFGGDGINLKYIRINKKIRFIQRILNIKWMRKIISSSKRDYFLVEMFDKWVAKDLDSGAEIIFCQAGISLQTIKRARELGMITILNSTGSHIESACKLFLSEYKKYGVQPNYDPKWLLQRTLKEYEEADYIAVLSSFAKRTFMNNNIPEERLLLIPLGIDLTSFQQVNKEDKIFRVIYCGHLSMRKGVHYLLEAFSSLRLKNAELWLIGHIFDDLKESLKKHEGNYKIIGHIKNDDLHKYYSQGSVCVLPSLDDGFNKVMLEAMACGLPVIITANTGAGDVIDDNIDGFIIPIRDTEPLKKKIMYMYENQNICEQMGQKAKDKIKQKFTIKNYTERMLAACNGLLN